MGDGIGVDAADERLSKFLRAKLEGLRIDIESECLRLVDERPLAPSGEAITPGATCESQYRRRPAHFASPTKESTLSAASGFASNFSNGYFAAVPPGNGMNLSSDSNKTNSQLRVPSRDARIGQPEFAGHLDPSDRTCQAMDFPMRSPRSTITITDQGMMSDIMQVAAVSERLPFPHKVPGKKRLDKWGEWMVSMVTVVNTFTIGISVDYWPTWAGWTVIDGLFAFAFLLYMLLVMYRLGGVGCYFLGVSRKCKLLSDADLRWRWFEFLLIVFAFAEVTTSILSESLAVDGMPPVSTLRLLRLTRIARLLRLAKFKLFSELSMMINGAIGGLRTLLWSTIMVALPLYAVALFMRLAIDSQSPVGRDGAAELFSTLPMAAFTIFRCVVGGDCSTEDGKPVFLLVSQQYGFRYAALYFVVMMFMVFGIFNVIAAIFVENTLDAARQNQKCEKRARLLDSKVFTEQVAELVRYVALRYEDFDLPSQNWVSEGFEEGTLFDKNGDINLDIAMQIHITPDFMEQLCAEPQFSQLLRKLDIADEDQVDLFGTLDVDGNGTIDLQELVIALRKLRGSSRKSDIVEVALIVRATQLQMNAFEKSVLDRIEDIQYGLEALQCTGATVGGKDEDAESFYGV